MGGKTDFVLAPPTLSEKMGFEPTPASKSQDSARAWGSQDFSEGKMSIESMLPAKVKTAQTCL